MSLSNRDPQMRPNQILSQIVLTTVLLFQYLPIWGQDDEIEQILIDRIEAYILNTEDENFDIQDLADHFRSYIDNPLSLNSASAEELLASRLFTDLQVLNLVNHIEYNGELISIYELQGINGFSPNDIRQLQPFLTVSGNPAGKQPLFSLQNLKHRLFLRAERIVEDQNGFIPDEEGNKAFAGSPNRLYTYYQVSSVSNELQAGFVGEKDPGETSFDASNTMFDYNSFHLYYNPRNRSSMIKQLALGDYIINLGQGLISYTGFTSGKSSFVTSIKRNGRVVRPYSSVNENLNLRGIATTLGFGQWNTTIFYSNTNRDANLNLADSSIAFTSLQSSGLHRTANEIEDKNTLGHQTLGGSIGWSSGNTKVNFNALYNQFDHPRQQNNQLYNLFGFQGGELLNMSLDYALPIGNSLLFGENAISDNGGFATVNGFLTSLNRFVDLSILHRYLSKDYQSLLANPFIESSTPTNEHGIYVGTVLTLRPRWKVFAYGDVWHHPWLRFTASTPTKGSEFLWRVQYEQRKVLQIYLQYRVERKGDNTTFGHLASTQVLDQNRTNLRIHLSHSLNRDVELRNRIEFSWYDKGVQSDKGLMIYQDVIYKPLSKPYSFTARLAYFDADSFDSRIYAYENNVLRKFAIPAFFGEGIRFYINTRFKINRLLQAEVRYATVKVLNDAMLGSGTTEIEGDNRNDLILQLRLSF